MANQYKGIEKALNEGYELYMRRTRAHNKVAYLTNPSKKDGRKLQAITSNTSMTLELLSRRFLKVKIRPMYTYINKEKEEGFCAMLDNAQFFARKVKGLIRMNINIYPARAGIQNSLVVEEPTFKELYNRLNKFKGAWDLTTMLYYFNSFHPN
jgi:hypothetical protein